MVKTLVSMLITLSLLIGATIFENLYVKHIFYDFQRALLTLQDKTVNQTANYEDGVVVREYWESKKNTMYVWLPHSTLQEVDYQLNEAIGLLYSKDYPNVISKLEVLLAMAENVPQTYSLRFENIF